MHHKTPLKILFYQLRFLILHQYVQPIRNLIKNCCPFHDTNDIRNVTSSWRDNINGNIYIKKIIIFPYSIEKTKKPEKLSKSWRRQQRLGSHNKVLDVSYNGIINQARKKNLTKRYNKHFTIIVKLSGSSSRETFTIDIKETKNKQVLFLTICM